MTTYWCLKSEPGELSMRDVLARPMQTIPWFGIRNFQARNFMRDEMQVGDLAFFYHSSCPQPGIAGIVEVVRRAYPDATQYDPKSKYFDPKATAAAPRWFNVDVAAVRETPFITLRELRTQAPLAKMRLLARGNRLSITPVTQAEWAWIFGMIKTSSASV